MYNRRLSQEKYRDTGAEKEKQNWVGNGYNLRQIRIELTHDCPLQCLHCSACSSSGNPLQLAQERAIGVINEFTRMGGKEVVITGGEPLVYAGLMAVLESSNSVGLKPILFTSGVAWDKKECRPISEEEVMRMKPLLSRIVFSLYSASEEKHDQITQTKNSLAMTLDAIRISSILGIPTDIHFVPMKINYEDLPGVADVSYSLGVQKIRVLRFVPHGRGEDYADELLPSVNDYRAFAQLVEITRRRYTGLVQIGAAFSALIPGVSSTCSAATGKIVVTADGLVAPCDGFKNSENAGREWSIYAKPLHEIYASSPFLHRIHAARKSQINDKMDARFLSDMLGCIAQKSLASGFVTGSAPDPCVSLDAICVGSCATVP